MLSSSSAVRKCLFQWSVFSLETAQGLKGTKTVVPLSSIYHPPGKASEMLRISILIKINICSRRFCQCFLETAKDKDFEKEREKAERRGRGRKGGGEERGQTCLSTRQSYFCRSHPTVYKRIKMHPHPTLNRIILL